MCSTHIKRNIVKCGGCEEVIESKHRHDFRTCKCDATFVDGGTAYVRVGFKDSVGFEYLTEYDGDCDCDVREREQDCGA